MRIGICGGTYDPFHIGHEALVRAVLQQELVDRVLIIPAGKPPHKQNEQVSMSRYRYEMAACPFKDEPRVQISDIEIKKDRPSYTLDTADQIQKKHPNDELFLIYGSDILHEIKNWYQPLQLLARWPLLIADRKGVKDSESRRAAESIASQTDARIRFFPAPQIDLSSTMIRQHAAAGEPVKDFVPECVNTFIHTHALYRWQSDLAKIEPSLWHELTGIERKLWHLLTPKRLLHSLDVLHYAIHLSVRHQEPLRPVAIAALLHDCAKCLPLPEQERLARLEGDPLLTTGPLAHGPASAVLAKRQFGIDDPVILQAIFCHTTGCAEMTRLDQIIFVADKAEPSRTYHDLKDIRAAAETDLDKATYLTLNGVGYFVQRMNYLPHPYAIAATESMKKRLKMKSQAKQEDEGLL